VTEIAARFGFVDVSSFAAQFEQRTGMTPKASRQRSMR
jgi:AraC-like DNA-binding protein